MKYSACERKIRYTSPQLANKEIRIIKASKAYKKFGNNKNVRSYYCSQCDGWHLSTKKKR